MYNCYAFHNVFSLSSKLYINVVQAARKPYKLIDTQEANIGKPLRGENPKKYPSFFGGWGLMYYHTDPSKEGSLRLKRRSRAQRFV
jgi:hypothetical protein